MNTTPLAFPMKPVYYGLAVWMAALGAVLMAAPDSWFGASWRYFHQLPHNGFWMGLVCVILGVAQTFTIWRDKIRTTAILIFLGGFVFWTAGILLGAEGLLGHQGLMEAPFLLYVGAHKFIHSNTLNTEYRRQRAVNDAM